MDYKIILTIVSIVIGFIGYYPYVRDVIKKTTRPHTFSWFAWGVLESVAFFAQISKGGGAGAWITFASALIVIFIAFQSLKNKDKYITKTDSIAFAGAIIGIVLWRITHNPLLAVIFVTLADALAFVPTFRKAYHKPNEETLQEYGASVAKWLIAIFALGSLNLTTWLYPASLVLTNAAFVTMALIRRHKLHGH